MTEESLPEESLPNENSTPLKKETEAISEREKAPLNTPGTLNNNVNANATANAAGGAVGATVGTGVRWATALTFCLLGPTLLYGCLCVIAKFTVSEVLWLIWPVATIWILGWVYWAAFPKKKKE